MDIIDKKQVFELSNGEKVTVDPEDLLMIFKGYRPRLMDIEVFKAIRSRLKKDLKGYLKGKIFHLSKVNDNVWNEYIKDMNHKPKQKGHTYVKKSESESSEK